MKFRIRSVEIEAEQYIPGQPLPKGVLVDSTNTPYVTTKKGDDISVAPYDWIIQEMTGGGCYPCDPDTFARKYEPVPAEGEG